MAERVARIPGLCAPSSSCIPKREFLKLVCPLVTWLWLVLSNGPNGGRYFPPTFRLRTTLCSAKAGDGERLEMKYSKTSCGSAKMYPTYTRLLMQSNNRTVLNCNRHWIFSVLSGRGVVQTSVCLAFKFVFRTLSFQTGICISVLLKRGYDL